MRGVAWTLGLGLAAWLVLLAIPAQAAPVRALPTVRLTASDARGCGQVTRAGSQGRYRLRGAAPGLCVQAAFAARLEPGGRREHVNVVLLVAAPHRFDPVVRTRLFVYRLHGRQLQPRFLGSGFYDRTLLSAERVPVAASAPGEPLDALRVVTTTPAGGRELWRCAFRRFPLSCEPEPDAGQAAIPSVQEARQ